MKKIDRISELERRYVSEVLDNNFRSSCNYSKVTQLEKEFAEIFDSKYAIAMVNGTATLHAALEAAEIGVGDEVICPPLTMSSTSLAALHAGATPVFADIDPRTFLVTPETVEAVITDKTKAIIPVSLYGLSTDIDGIMAVAKAHDLIVIEDDAQCFLGKYKGRVVGSTADMSSFSFQASKHMTAGEGGMVTTSNPELALKLRRYSGLGYGSIGLEKGRISKDDIQSPDFDRHETLGWNYRPSDLCGAVALAQLQRLEELVEMRILAAGHFMDAIEGTDWLVPQFVPADCESSYWAFVMRLDTNHVDWQTFRRKFIELGGHGIYGAWKLSYLEPAYLNGMFLGREKYLTRPVEELYYSGICPVAEAVQPQLLQMKTNYWDEAIAVEQAEILKQTIQSFE